MSTLPVVRVTGDPERTELLLRLWSDVGKECITRLHVDLTSADLLSAHSTGYFRVIRFVIENNPDIAEFVKLEACQGLDRVKAAIMAIPVAAGPEQKAS